MQISMLIGKQILTPEGERLGYVMDVRLDRLLQKPVMLAAADENEEEFFLPMRAVLAVGDAVIAKNLRAAAPSGEKSPVGLAAFSCEGEALGSVADWIGGDVRTAAEPVCGETAASLLLSKDGTRSLVPVDRVRIGETAIVYPSPEERKKRARAKPKGAQNKSDPVRKKTRDGAISPPHPVISDRTEAQSPSELPPPPEQNAENFRANLLGRRVKRDVFDGEGSPVALKGERITPATLALARRKNRLLALTVNTLTNLL